jgi:hypothetical protein
LIYSSAEATAQTLVAQSQTGYVSRDYADTEIPGDAVLTELANMRKEHLLSFNFVTLEGVDKQTGRISCSADVQVTTASQDRTAAAKDAMSRAVQSLAVNDLAPPLGLAAGTTHANVDFWREPNAGSRFKWVFNAQNDLQLVSAIILIASERAILHSPKTFRMPASAWVDMPALRRAAENPPDDAPDAAVNTGPSQ